MKLKIGDFVRFVDEPIEGRITSINDTEIIGVTDDSGFEIPVLRSKVTLVHGNMSRADDEEDDEQVSSTVQEQFVGEGIYIAVTGDEKAGLASFHIVNSTSYQVAFVCNTKSGQKNTGVRIDKIRAKSSLQFYSANFSAIGKWPTFVLQILRMYEQPHEPLATLETEIRIRPVDINEKKRTIEQLDTKGWLFQLDAAPTDIGIQKLKNWGK